MSINKPFGMSASFPCPFGAFHATFGVFTYENNDAGAFSGVFVYVRTIKKSSVFFLSLGKKPLADNDCANAKEQAREHIENGGLCFVNAEQIAVKNG